MDHIPCTLLGGLNFLVQVVSVTYPEGFYLYPLLPTLPSPTLRSLPGTHYCPGRTLPSPVTVLVPSDALDYTKINHSHPQFYFPFLPFSPFRSRITCGSLDLKYDVRHPSATDQNSYRVYRLRRPLLHPFESTFSGEPFFFISGIVLVLIISYFIKFL